MLLPLGDRDVHVWYVLTDAVSEPVSLRRCEEILSDEERERADRFTYGDGRQLYIVSHTLLRIVLSSYTDVAPRSWHFSRNALGKPEIHPSHESPTVSSLCFNLSHTTGLAACVVARNREVGVDAEDVTRRGRKLGEELIRRCLSPEEFCDFLMVPEEHRDQAFFDHWTLKEAYLKARGFGLLLPLEGITFSWPHGRTPEGPVSVSFNEEIGDEPGAWQFDRFNPTATHKVAVAARRFDQKDLNIVARELSASFMDQEVLEAVSATRPG